MNLYDCVIFAAHPDDAFIGAGGTLIKLSKEKKKILIVCATNGENSDSAKGLIRKSELEKCVEIYDFGIRLLNLPDGDLTYYKKNLYDEFTKILVQVNPLMIFMHNFCDMHSDHRAVCESAKLAIEKLWHFHKENTRLKNVLQYAPIKLSLEMFSGLKINYLCDISEFIDEKEKLISVHQSQQPYIDKNIIRHRAFSALLGSMYDFAYLEGFFQDEKVTFINSKLEGKTNVL